MGPPSVSFGTREHTLLLSGIRDPLFRYSLGVPKGPNRSLSLFLYRLSVLGTSFLFRGRHLLTIVSNSTIHGRRQPPFLKKTGSYSLPSSQPTLLHSVFLRCWIRYISDGISYFLYQSPSWEILNNVPCCPRHRDFLYE